MQRLVFFFFFNDTATTEIYTLSLPDALPIYTRISATPTAPRSGRHTQSGTASAATNCWPRSEEHTSELQSRLHLVCRLLLEKQTKLDGKDNAADLAQEIAAPAIFMVENYRHP